MPTPIGQCGRYLWSADIEPAEWIRPDDYADFTAQHSLGRIYHCQGETPPYIAIQANRRQAFRVNPEGFSPVPDTPYYIGDSVRIQVGSQAGAEAEIVSMGWHTNKQKILFGLAVNGKRRSRQYWEEDIAPVA